MKTILILATTLLTACTTVTAPDGTVTRTTRGPTAEEIAALQLLVKNGLVDAKAVKNFSRP